MRSDRFGHCFTPLLAPLGIEVRKRERVRCSSLVDWPVYPRLRGTMQALTRSRNSGWRSGSSGHSGARRIYQPPKSPPVDARPTGKVRLGEEGTGGDFPILALQALPQPATPARPKKRRTRPSRSGPSAAQAAGGAAFAGPPSRSRRYHATGARWPQPCWEGASPVATPHDVARGTFRASPDAKARGSPQRGQGWRSVFICASHARRPR